MGVIEAALLAVGLMAAAQIVVRADHDCVLAQTERLCDLKLEAHIAAAVRADAHAVDPHLAGVVDRAEIEKDALARRLFGQRECAPVPYGGHEVDVFHAGEPAFRAEGHCDFAFELFLLDKPARASGRAVIDFKLPLTV